MPTLPEDITPEDEPDPTTGHDPAHEELHRIHNLGPTFVDPRGYGAAGNGVDPDDAGILDALNKGPSYGIIRPPSGEYVVDIGTLDLLFARHIQGDGADTTWFTPPDDSAGATPAMYVNVASPSGSVRGVYGPRIRGIGINLENAPSALGLRTGEDGGDGTTSGWTWLDDIRIEGGTICWNNQATNIKLTNFHFLNPSEAFYTCTETGLETRIWDGVFEVGPGFTVPVVMEIAIATDGQKGAIYLRDVALNNGGTVNMGIYEHCDDTGTASAPIRATNVTLDNLSGPAWNFVNVTDSQIMGGWSNCAAGTTNGAIRIEGGGSHTIMGQQQMNGGSGSACSFDLVDGPAGVALIGNNPATGPYYRLTGAAPTDLLILDRIWQVASLANITNDMEALLGAMSPLWTPPRRAQRPYVRESGTNPPKGYATFPGGSPNYVVINHTGIKATTRVHTSRERFGATGTAGHIACSVADHVVGTSFTVFSNSATDVGSFIWWLEEVY